MIPFPQDILKAPMWVIKIFAMAFNRAFLQKVEDPEEKARTTLQMAWERKQGLIKPTDEDEKEQETKE